LRPVVEHEAVSGLVELMDGEARIRLPGLATFDVGRDSTVGARPEPGTGQDEVACFTGSTAGALASLLAGTFPLRAAAVGRESRMLVICGRAAAGKSALAASLALLDPSYWVASDKVVQIDGLGRLLAGASGGVELWPPVAHRLGIESKGAVVRPSLAKRRYELRRFAGTDQPVTALVAFLDIDNRLAEPELHQLVAGREKLQALVSAQWHRRLIAPLGLGLGHLEWASSVARSIPMVRVNRPRQAMTLATVTELVKNAFEAGAIGAAETS
jgi:hypothetical protein